jgi:hypothetical protein
VALAPSSIWAILHRNNVCPSPTRTGSSWKEFVRSVVAGTGKHALMRRTDRISEADLSLMAIAAQKTPPRAKGLPRS